MIVHLGSTRIGLWRYLALWTAVVVVFAWQGRYHDARFAQIWSWVDYLRWSMIQWYTWAALAPVVFRLAERFPLSTPLRFIAVAAHAAASVAVTMVAMFAGALLSSLFEPGSIDDQLRQFIGKHFATGMLAYWGLVAIQHALHFQAEKTRREVEASQLAAELAQSRLQSLKTQLQPHFLFNTLHAIVTLLDEDTLKAEDMLLRLSDLLRAFLEDYDGQEIPLRRELELLDLYLGIQRMRFGDRLATQVCVAPDALDAAVPSLLLQPLVENAIKHGIGQRVGDDRIEIDCRRDGSALCIEVRNRNSSLADAPAAAGHGIGLSNTRLRLRELHGDAAELRLDMLWPQGVTCRIRLPYRSIDDADDDMPEHRAA